MSPNLLRQPNFAALVALAWLVVALVLLLQYWDQTARTLLDTDDAMRLVQMKSWLAGHGWYDLHEPRLQPPTGYDSHWSRLVDAGLAGFYFLLKLGVDPASAERLMRAWWPLLWLLPTMAGMVAIVWRLAGRDGAIVSLLLAMVGVPAYQQFMPGRIDHHNVQIALTLLAVAATVWSDRKRWAAPLAGALCGIAPAIGLECLPYLIVCGAGFALRFVFDRNAALALRDYGLALALALAVGFVADVGPNQWTVTHCDAMAINNLAAGAGVGLLLAVAGQLRYEQVAMRAFAVIASGTVALAVYLILDPRCAGGPFAMVDPRIWPIWHSHVRELQPLLWVIQFMPLTAAGIAAFPVAAVIAALALGTQRRDAAFLVAAAVFAVAFVIMVAAIRGYSYAIWLGMPLVAAAAIRSFEAFRITALPARLAVGLFVTPMALSAGAITLTYASGLDDTESFTRPESKPCFATASYAPLASLPPGLVVTDISYGPFLLALTPHSAMAAPYHRLTTGIVLDHAALASPPDQARIILEDAEVTYVMVCGPRPPDGLYEPARGQSLWGQLQAGKVPDWLETIPDMQPFSVYRVKSD